MLSCIDKTTGEKVLADKARKLELRQLSSQGHLICQHSECQHHPVIFRCGNHRIAHFAHKTPYPYVPHPSESFEHDLGKNQLNNMLARVFPESMVDVEVGIKETGQEADVLVVHPDGKKWAFEYQASPLTSEKWIERHRLYSSNNIKDFWILSSNQVRRDNSFKISSFIKEIYKADKNNNDWGKLCFLDTKSEVVTMLFQEGEIFGEVNKTKDNSEDIPLNQVIFKNSDFYFQKYEDFKKLIIGRKEREKREEEERQKKRQEAWNHIEIPKKEYYQKDFVYQPIHELETEPERNIKLLKKKPSLKDLEKTHKEINKRIDQEIREKSKNPLFKELYLRMELSRVEITHNLRIYREGIDQYPTPQTLFFCRKCGKPMAFTEGKNRTWMCRKCNFHLLIIQKTINTFEDLDKIKNSISVKIFNLFNNPGSLLGQF